MQLKKIKAQMSLATCALLQVAAPAVQAAEADWDIETSALYYSESDSSEFSVRGEFIRQTIDNGSVPDNERTSDLDALVLQFSYSLIC